MGMTSEAGRSRVPPWLILLAALLVFVFVQYGWTLSFPFAFDDSHTIEHNPVVQSASGLVKVWTSASAYSVTPDNWGYRPVTGMTNVLAWLAGDGSTVPFHILKKAVHAVVCFFLCLVWVRLWRSPGFFPEPPPTLGAGKKSWMMNPWITGCALAFVFAIHPMNVQVVDYIAATSTLLAGAFFLAAYYVYLRYRDGEVGVLGLFLSGGLYALSILSKEEGITLIAVIALTELMIPSKSEQWKVRRRGLVVYVVVGAACALLLKSMFAESSNLARGTLPRWPYFMTQWRAYLHYLLLTIWPLDLNADNLEFGFNLSITEPAVLLSLAGNLALLVGAWLTRERYPILLFSLLWFYITISPASSIIPLAEPVNDHRSYIAYFGVVGAIFPWILYWVGKLATPRFSVVVAWGLFLALNIGAQIRNRVWASSENLWADTVEKNPHSGRAKNNLALVYMARQEWAEGKKLLEDCEAVAPYYPYCKTNLGMILSATGEEVAADHKLLEAVNLAPWNTMSRMFYADFLFRRGRYNEAIVQYTEIDRQTGGGNLEATLRLVEALRDVGRKDEAQAKLDEARRLFPDHPYLRLPAFGGTSSS